MIFNALRDGINVQTYRKRGIILKTIKNDESIFKSGDIFHIDCQTTMEELVSKLFKEYPSLNYKSDSCNNCSLKNMASTLLITNLNDMENLQLSIEQGLYKNCLCYQRKQGYLR